MRLLICDDTEGRASRWKEAVESLGLSGQVEVAVPIELDLLSAIGSLEKRRELARLRREGKTPALDEDDEQSVGHNLFDDFDVVILDYDLFWLGVDRTSEHPALPGRPRLTGEEVAYLVRCFSRCTYIVGLNQFDQFGENTFNLDLRGHLESYADLNIGGVQLGNPGLWGRWVDGYRPSSWPNLLSVVSAQNDRVAFVQNHMNEPLLAVLGLLDDGSPTVPREALEFLGPGDLAALTFEDFAQAGRPRGLDSTDAAWEPEALARIAASRVAKWLEREVLSGGEALVDRPHLVERFPSLLGEATDDVGAFNRASYPRDDDVGLSSPALDDARFVDSFWLSRPVWRWQRLASDKRIAEVADPWSADAPPFRFCEDVSRFLPEQACLVYSAEVHSPWVTRYVAGPPSLSRATEVAPELYDGPFALSKVNYEPSDVLES